MKRIETDRLILRKVTLKDVDDLFNNWASDVDTTKYLTFDTHKESSETEKIVRKMLARENDGYFEWVVEVKSNHEVIGIISAKRTDENKCLEIGYSISSQYWNKGLVTEGLREVIRYLFNECNVNKIKAIISEDNIKSIKVASKCGLSFAEKLKGENQNLVVYSIIKNKYIDTFFRK